MTLSREEKVLSTPKRLLALRKGSPIGSGEFCGVPYHQDSSSLEIRYEQSEYARHLKPISLSKDRQRQKEDFATDKEISVLRAVNGAANWLSTQTRPDLSIQASFSQQSFPKPRVKDFLYVNQLIHRARQHADVSITVQSIPWERLAPVFHSDAGFGNASGSKTQAGYVLALTDKSLEQDQGGTMITVCLGILQACPSRRLDTGRRNPKLRQWPVA